MAEKVAKMIDDIDELFDRIEKQNKKQKEILKQLDKVEQPYRAILELHYIEGKPLVEVACELKYKYEYAKKANSIGLRKFEEIVKIFPKST